jgi:Mg/Co/Ni transporter MgtE
LDQRAYLEALPVQERIVRYRQLAHDALMQAFSTVDPEAREGLLIVAKYWQRLATGLQKMEHKKVPSGAS